MKTIQPVTVWFNGQQVQASVLNAVVVADNLNSYANFNYQLLQIIPIPEGLESLQPVVDGVLTMSGEVYDNWDNNEYAYNWVAEQLNLVITGDYVKPVATTTTTTTEAPVTTTSTTTISSK